MKKIFLLFLLLFQLSIINCQLSIVFAQNPYLPLWEHLPDGEPRVFEDTHEDVS